MYIYGNIKHIFYFSLSIYLHIYIFFPKYLHVEPPNTGEGAIINLLKEQTPANTAGTKPVQSENARAVGSGAGPAARGGPGEP